MNPVSSSTNPRAGAGMVLLLLLPAWLAVAVLVSKLQWVWTHQPEMQFGWIVLMLSAYLFWENWPQRPPLTGRVGILDILAAALGIALLFVVQTYQAAFGTSAIVACGNACGTMLVAFASVRSVLGWPGWKRFGFPFLFLLVAVPLPSAVLNPVTSFLQNLIATINVEVLNLAGVPARRLGSLIHLPKGTVGVNEACSGIRSLQSSVMATLFIGYLTLRSNVLRTFLFLGGIAVAVLGNTVRSLYLSFTAHAKGVESVNQVHDAAGWSILLFTAVGVGLLSWWMARIEKRAAALAEPDGP